MKRKLIILAATILVAVTTTIVVSCKKDKESSKTNLTEKNLQDWEPSETDLAMISFGEKMKAASHERSGETMPLSEALNTLTNYQNFTMCDASYYSMEMLTDTFRVTINVADGQILLSELNRIYETTRPEILARLNSLNSSEKNIYLIKIVVGQTARNGLDNYTGTLDVNVVSRMIDGFSSPNTIVFDSTDYWYDFEYLGKCDIYEGQCIGQDCVTRLNLYLHLRRPVLRCSEGYRVYLRNIEDYDREAINYPDPNSPNGHYAWPWRAGSNLPQCVSPSEMTYYLNAIENAMDDLEDYYEKTIVEFFLDRAYKLPWKEPIPIWEAWLDFTVADVDCTFVGIDD